MTKEFYVAKVTVLEDSDGLVTRTDEELALSILKKCVAQGPTFWYPGGREGDWLSFIESGWMELDADEVELMRRPDPDR